MQILLADDDIDDCMMFSDVISEFTPGIDLQIVHDGENLMRMLTRKTQVPDIVFLDLNMPRKNGSACLQEIKSDKNLQNIPVVIISTSCDDLLADVLYKKGAHFYICKPSDFKLLKNKVYYTITQIQHSKSRPSRDKFLIDKTKN